MATAARYVRLVAKGETHRRVPPVSLTLDVWRAALSLVKDDDGSPLIEYEGKAIWLPPSTLGRFKTVLLDWISKNNKLSDDPLISEVVVTPFTRVLALIAWAEINNETVSVSAPEEAKP